MQLSLIVAFIFICIKDTHGLVEVFLDFSLLSRVILYLGLCKNLILIFLTVPAVLGYFDKILGICQTEECLCLERM